MKILRFNKNPILSIIKVTLILLLTTIHVGCGKKLNLSGDSSLIFLTPAKEVSNNQETQENNNNENIEEPEKVIIPPFAFKSLSINGEENYAFGGHNVTLNIDVKEATSMYVTNTPGCLSGGTWEPILTSKNWILPFSSFSSSIYVKFKDNKDVETNCYSASINTYFAQELSSDPFSWNTCLMKGGKLKCWANNDYGQLGQGDIEQRGDNPNEMGSFLNEINLGTNKTVLAYDFGEYHACAILNDKSLKCWGRNSYGQLGYGDIEHRGDNPNEMSDNLNTVDLGTDKNAVQVAACHDHTCALLNDGTVKCWGRNNYGQLGYGDLNNRGDEPNEMGSNLNTVDLGTGRKAIQLTTSLSDSVCALLDNGTVKCWGRDGWGQLGRGTNNLHIGDEPGEMGDNLDPIDLGASRTVRRVLGGDAFYCALLENNDVKCWGYNLEGELGLEDTNDRGDAPGEMGDNLAVLSFGDGKTVKDLYVGGWHSCVLLNTDETKCWGFNGQGQLGVEANDNRGDGVGEMGNNLEVTNFGTGLIASEMAIGYDHTCALLSDDSVKCFGNNDHAQLGLGHMNVIGDEAGEMGDFLESLSIF